MQYALISLSGNNGKGAVIKRREVVLQDTIQYGKLLAVKHANGRDWWLPINELNTNRYYIYLIDPGGIHLAGRQTVGEPILDGLGQAVFSPDGNYYAVVNCVSWDDPGSFLDVFRFDRCTGQFSEHRHTGYPGRPSAGVAISPNSRYLYVNYNTKLFQYDLFEPDLKTSEILVGEYIPPPPDELPATFYQMQLAPDNKIYICGTNSVKYLHVIHEPDKPGLDCQFERIGIKLPTYNNGSLTYNPFHRIGPIDGSSCDTLGLDNHPKAWYRYEQDTLDFLAVTFHDLSYYEPETWSWDFGDGSPISHERYPQHHFDSAGVYEVCLTVNNINSSDTHCKTLYLGVSGTESPFLQSEINVFPNPVDGLFSVSLSTRLNNPKFRLFNHLGQQVREKRMAVGFTDIESAGLPSGMYFWQVAANGVTVKSGKIVKK